MSTCLGRLPSGSAVKSPPVMQKSEETRVWSLGQEDPLEEEMATHSRILAWIMPWTEEPGGLQSMGVAESDPTEATEHARTPLRIMICCSVSDQGQEILPPSLYSFFLFSCFLFFFSYNSNDFQAWPVQKPSSFRPQFILGPKTRYTGTCWNLNTSQK